MTANLFHEFQTLHQKYDHLWNFMHELLGVIKEMEVRNIKENEKKRKEKQIRCKFFNKGFCKKGKSCNFQHPEQNCKKHCEGKECDKGSLCKSRHPHRCQFWQSGECSRGKHCLYLHTIDNLKDNKDKVDKATIDKPDANREKDIMQAILSEENFDEDISTEDIIKYYESRTDLDEIDPEHQLSTDEIIKLYENSDDDEKFPSDADDVSTEDLVKLYENKMSNKHQKEDPHLGLIRSTRKSFRIGSKS